MDGPHPLVSVVLATHDRRDVLATTLDILRSRVGELPSSEIIVVDGASTDDTVRVARSLADSVVALPYNAGSCGKAYGVDRARGVYTVFLDDDARPRPGALARMIEHFERDAELGAAGFTVHLPGGGQESAALPGVFVGCGVGFRTDALRGVGGLDRTFFMQAEEYDLALRLAAAGWKIEVFDDLHVDHLKSPTARRTDRTAHLDIRNNLRVVARYLPRRAYRVYRADAIERYRWLAMRDGHEDAHARGLRAGRLLALRERPLYLRRRLDAGAFERLYQWETVAQRMERLAAGGVRRIAFASLGKNVYAFHAGAQRAGLVVAAIADDAFAAPGRCYRGTPIVPLGQALTERPDAWVVSNMSPVHARQMRERLMGRTDAPVHDWYGLPSASAEPPATWDGASSTDGPFLSPFPRPAGAAR
jgi:GT2 family glycosyltransferase